MILLLQLFFYANIYIRQRNENTAEIYANINRTDMVLSQTSEQIEKTGQSIANNPYVQEYLQLQNDSLSESITERSVLAKNISNFFGGITGSSDIILDIALVDRTRSLLTYKNIFTYSIYQVISRQIDFESDNPELAPVWISYSADDSSLYRHFAYVVPIRHTTGLYEERNQRTGYCILWSRQKWLSEVVTGTAATVHSLVAITDGNNRIIALNSGRDTQAVVEPIARLMGQVEAHGLSNTVGTYDFLGQSSYVLIKTNPQSGWKSINITPVHEVYADIARLFYQGIGLTAVSIAVLFLLGLGMIQGINRPLTSILATLKEIGEGNREARLKVRYKNEFGTIAGNINDMLNKSDWMTQHIFDMQEQLHKLELMQKESEILALQSQINPHFLYNTLECIRSIATVYKAKEIVVIVGSMANIFRYSINGGITTTVQAELECVTDYYRIISIRYEGRLQLSINVDESLNSCTMIKMSLQPLVENCVRHGLEVTDDELQIAISGWRDGEFAYFAVSDTGSGMDKEQVQELNDTFQTSWARDAAGRQRSRIGLANINGRIKLYYGKSCGLLVDSEPHIRTCITVKVKLDRN
jgi:two-component system sensor histidine kinase YesM